MDGDKEAAEPAILELEQRLPLDRVTQAFISEFSYLDPDIARSLSLLKGNTRYLDFIDEVHGRTLGGNTSYAYRDLATGAITHKVKLAASGSEDQDQHNLTHEWIHGLSIGDVGSKTEIGQEVHARIGPIRLKGILSGNEEEDWLLSPEGNFSPALVRLWEGFTEWKARRMSLKYFPEKFDDFHDSFLYGYQAASIVEWLEEQAIAKGRGDDFVKAADKALVNGNDQNMITLLTGIFPNKDPYGTLLSAVGEEVALEWQVNKHQITEASALKQVRNRIYPGLLSKLQTSL